MSRFETDRPGQMDDVDSPIAIDQPKPPKPRAATRMRIAITAAWLLVAVGVLAYAVPGTPWAHSGGATSSVGFQGSHGHASTAPSVGTAPSAAAGPAAPAGTASIVPAPGAMMDMMRGAANPYTGFIRGPQQTVVVDVTPATIGLNTVAITVLDARGAPAEVQRWSATATLPGSTLGPITVPLSSYGSGVAAAAPQLPAAGRWTFAITVQLSGATPTTFTHVVPIAAAA
jgi:hypothetical protein